MAILFYQIKHCYAKFHGQKCSFYSPTHWIFLLPFKFSHEDNKYVPIFWRNHHAYFHRHEDGPIAQSNFGEMLVFPGATLHMECLSLKVQDILIKYFVILTFLFPEATLHIMCLSLKVLDFWYLNFFIWTFFFIFFAWA